MNWVTQFITYGGIIVVVAPNAVQVSRDMKIKLYEFAIEFKCMLR